jgi:hypothetical protein
MRSYHPGICYAEGLQQQGTPPLLPLLLLLLGGL